MRLSRFVSCTLSSARFYVIFYDAFRVKLPRRPSRSVLYARKWPNRPSRRSVAFALFHRLPRCLPQIAQIEFTISIFFHILGVMFYLYNVNISCCVIIIRALDFSNTYVLPSRRSKINLLKYTLIVRVANYARTIIVCVGEEFRRHRLRLLGNDFRIYGQVEIHRIRSVRTIYRKRRLQKKKTFTLACVGVSFFRRLFINEST